MNFKKFDKLSTYDILEDLLRVEQATHKLHTMLNQILLINTTMTIKTNWSRDDFITMKDMIRIRNNIESLARIADPTVNLGFVQEYFDYIIANELERGLKIANDFLTYLIETLDRPSAGFYYANSPLFLLVERS